MLQSPARNSRFARLLSGTIIVAGLAAACTTQIARHDSMSGSAAVPFNVPFNANTNVASSDPSGSATPSAGEEDVRRTTTPAAPSSGIVVSMKQAIARPSGLAQDTVYFDFQVDTPALISRGAKVLYPPTLREAKIEGTVLVEVIVGVDGVPQMHSFRILRSDHRAFSEVVEEALSQSRFAPAKLRGRAVQQLVQIPYLFQVSRSNGDSTLATVGIGGRSASRNAPSGAASGGSLTIARVDSGVQRVPSSASAVADGNSERPYFDFQVNKPAQLVSGTAPVYPPALKEQNIQGTALVQFVVDADGVPDMETFKVLRTPDPAFGEAIRASLPTLRYTPAQLADGRKVKQLVQQPFAFKP